MFKNKNKNPYLFFWLYCKGEQLVPNLLIHAHFNSDLLYWWVRVYKVYECYDGPTTHYHYLYYSNGYIMYLQLLYMGPVAGPCGHV
jgi:hypothetical protein